MNTKLGFPAFYRTFVPLGILKIEKLKSFNNRFREVRAALVVFNPASLFSKKIGLSPLPHLEKARTKL